MLLSHTQLDYLRNTLVIYLPAEGGEAGYRKVPFEQINATSIDITLGDTVLVESLAGPRKILSLKDREPLNVVPRKIPDDGLLIMPGEFLLAHSAEMFNLPDDISAEYKLKSSMARIGLEHMNAGWCDAGWHGSSLTLELKNVTNNHAIRVHRGDRIGQVVFFLHVKVPPEHSYAARGRYNNDKIVQGIKR